MILKNLLRTHNTHVHKAQGCPVLAVPLQHRFEDIFPDNGVNGVVHVGDSGLIPSPHGTGPQAESSRRDHDSLGLFCLRLVCWNISHVHVAELGV